jgi:hypothetical protein
MTVYREHFEIASSVWFQLARHNQTRNVRRFAERGISDYIEVSKTSQPEGLADPMASGLLHIAEQLGGIGQAQTGIQGEDAGTGVLCFTRGRDT